jgi:hypothetical protein
MLEYTTIDTVDAYQIEPGDVLAHTALGPLTVTSFDDLGESFLFHVTDEREDYHEIPAHPFDKFDLLAYVNDEEEI